MNSTLKNFILPALAVTQATVCTAANEQKPNIIIMMADDMGYGDLGCFGNKIIETPNLDRLSHAGVRFTACYSGHPVCSPSRAAMMAGRTPFRNGIYTYIPDKSCVYLREKEATIGEICKLAGYDTGFFGKWGLIGNMDDNSQPHPEKHGFDFWFATHNNAIPSHKNPVNFYENGKAVGEIKGYSSQIVVDHAMKWLDSRKDKSKPVCLVLWFHEPHNVLAQPESFRQKYAQYEGHNGEYYANVSHLDFQIGRFIKYLDENKMRENTWMTFTSDNGPVKDGGGQTGGFRGYKSSFYEGGYREPMIMYWKGTLDGGKEIDTPIAFVDFVPTLYALFNIKPLNNEPLDGTSLLPVFKGEELNRETVLTWVGLGEVSIRKGDWKLVGNFEKLKPGDSFTNYLKTRKIKSFELYNLKTDPFETHDLSKETTDVLAGLVVLINKRVVDVQQEIVPWNGLNVIPSSAAQNVLGKTATIKNWNKMTAEEQDYLGQKKK